MHPPAGRRAATARSAPTRPEATATRRSDGRRRARSI
nr:MAG TPA: hypothetical protein [Caudoviricetes sp.]